MAERLVWAPVVRHPVPLVYLDLNHYIYLAKASTSPENALIGYPELLESATAAVKERRAIFPLSGTHLFELSGIKDPRHRNRIADVMEKLSHFGYLLGRTELARLEIQAGIRDVLNEPPSLCVTPLIGRSFGWAFGMMGGLKIVDASGCDASKSLRKEMGDDGYEKFMRFANYSLERSMLAGPSDEEIPQLEAYGYDPDAARSGQESRLAFELELSARLNDAPVWRRGRLRDVVSGREIAHEWPDAINEVNRQRVADGHLALDLGEKEARRLFSAMPHSQVAISMKTRYHRNPAHRWTTNDIADIDALSVAYAYCDAVFTDKAARSALEQSKELRILKTYLPRSAKQLANWLDKLPKVSASDFLVPHPPKISYADD